MHRCEWNSNNVQLIISARRGILLSICVGLFNIWKQSEGKHISTLHTRQQNKRKHLVFDRSKSGIPNSLHTWSQFYLYCVPEMTLLHQLHSLPSTSDIWEVLKHKEWGETGDLKGRNVMRPPEILELQRPSKWCQTVTWRFNICWSGANFPEASVLRA